MKFKKLLENAARVTGRVEDVNHFRENKFDSSRARSLGTEKGEEEEESSGPLEKFVRFNFQLEASKQFRERRSRSKSCSAFVILLHSRGDLKKDVLIRRRIKLDCITASLRLDWIRGASLFFFDLNNLTVSSLKPRRASRRRSSSAAPRIHISPHVYRHFAHQIWNIHADRLVDARKAKSPLVDRNLTRYSGESRWDARRACIILKELLWYVAGEIYADGQTWTAAFKDAGAIKER